MPSRIKRAIKQVEESRKKIQIMKKQPIKSNQYKINVNLINKEEEDMYISLSDISDDESEEIVLHTKQKSIKDIIEMFRRNMESQRIYLDELEKIINY
jgi:hypothetical protein